VNTPTQVSHHTTKYHFVQHTCIKKNSLGVISCNWLSEVFKWHIFKK
jgi:hypothetical protein